MPQLLGGGSSLSISALMQQLQGQQDRANAANETRYNQALQSQGTAHTAQSGLYNSAYNDVANVGGVANQRIDKQAKNATSAAHQGLISRGLGNTSIVNSVERGYADDAELQHQGVDEQQAQLRSGIKIQQAGNEGQFGDRIAGIMERRSDTAPDTSLYSGLIQQAMAGQAGSGKTTTTQYIGSDGRSYNSPGAAMASGGSGSGSGSGTYNAPRASPGGGPSSGGGDSNRLVHGDPGAYDPKADDGYTPPQMAPVGPISMGQPGPQADQAPQGDVGGQRMIPNPGGIGGIPVSEAFYQQYLQMHPGYE